jgi:hypothetical protein
MSKQYKAPDVTAPRFRQTGHNIIDAEFVKRFKEKHERHNNLTISDIRKIIKKFNETLWENIIETRDGVNLPEGIGHLFIGSCKLLRDQNIDYAKSIKYGVTVNLKNWETDGKIAKIFYSSYASKYKFEFRECWSFKGCRNFKRAVAKNFPENWTMYVSVESSRKMKKMYTAATIKDIRERNTKTKLKDYNEFDL